MQITEQLIERIARRVFNSMFAPALRQSNVQGGGTSGSVRYADEAGHAASADSADAVPWTGVSGKPATATRWPTWSEVTGKPNRFTPSAHTHAWGDITSGVPATASRWPSWSEVISKPNSFTPSAHTHAWGDITSGVPATASRWPSWSEVISKPNSFTPSAHTHAWGDITSGVPATASRWPSWSEVTSKPTSKTAWGRTYLNSNSEFQNVSGDLSAGSSGGTISQFHSIELNSAGSLSGYGGFIDFHFNGSSSNYTSRIVEDASGKLNLNQAVFVNYNGNVGIGTDSPSYKLHVAGAIYCTGGFTFLSDIRKKNVKTYQWSPTLDMIANAPIIRYTLKGDKTHREHIGSVAQYWQKVMPETVTDTDDTLSMDGTTIALTSVIALARVVKQMKKEIALLKNGKQ